METYHVQNSRYRDSLSWTLTLLVFCLALSAAPLNAQSLQMLSSSPEDMAVNVALTTTVTFTFNKAIDPNVVGTDFFHVRPQQAISIHGIQQGADGKSVSFNVTHQPDTDYTWFILGLVAQDRDVSEKMYVLNYTTKTAASGLTIEGSLSYKNIPNFLFMKAGGQPSSDEQALLLEKIERFFGINGSASEKALLSTPIEREAPPQNLPGRKPFLQSGSLAALNLRDGNIASGQASVEDPHNWGYAAVWLMTDLDWMDPDYESDGPGDQLVNAAIADPETRSYRIQNVHPGEYYVVSLLFKETSQRYRTDIYAVGLLLDDDDEFATITVTESNLTNIDITLYGFLPELANPTDATEAFATAKNFVQENHPAARPVMLFGEDSSLPFDFFKQLQSLPVPEPTGKSYFWECLFLEDADSLVHFVIVMEEEVLIHEIVHFSDLMDDAKDDEGPPEGIGFEDIRTLPDTFVSSQNALTTVRHSGLDSLLTLLQPDSWYDLDYTLSSFYFEFDDILDDDAPPFWEIYFFSFTWDHDRHIGVINRAFFLVDAENGTLLYKEVDTWEDSPTHPPHTLHYTDSHPEDHSAQVPLEMIAHFGFNDGLHYHTVAPHAVGNQLFILPRHSMEIRNMWLNEEQNTVNYDIKHEENTDYVWLFMATEGLSGSRLDDALVINYTTRSDFSPQTVTGNLFSDGIPGYSPGQWWQDDYQHDSRGPQYRTIVTLLDNPYFLTGQSNDYLEGMRYAGSILDEYGYYRIDNVRNGEYYLAAFVFDYAQGYPMLAGLGFHADSEGAPLPLFINNNSPENQNLMVYPYGEQVDPVRPIDAIEAFDLASLYMNDQNPDALPVFIYGKDAGFDYYYRKETQDRTLLQPSGKSVEWSLVFSDPDEETIYWIGIFGDEIAQVDEGSLSDLPIVMRPPPHVEIEFLPDVFISSQTALDIAMTAGLDEILDDTDPGARIEITYTLSHLFFLHPDLLDESTPVFWEVQFHSYTRDEVERHNWVNEALYLIDAVEGTLLNSRVRTFSDYVEPVAMETAFVPADSLVSLFYPNSEFIQAYGRENPRLPDYPTGKSREWMLVWFDFDTEMIDIINTRGEDTRSWEHQRFPLSDVPPQERPEALTIKPAGSFTVGSQAALAIAMDNGLREELDGVPEPAEREIREVKVDYNLHSFYTEYPDILDEDSNPFWTVSMEALIYDNNWESLHYKFRSYHLIDAFTGDYLGSVVKTSSEQVLELPPRMVLHQNYPNPFNPVTTIRWDQDAEREVRLAVYDLLGRRVATLVNGPMPAGRHQVDFDGSNLGSGIYIYQLETAGLLLNRKMTLIK